MPKFVPTSFTITPVTFVFSWPFVPLGSEQADDDFRDSNQSEADDILNDTAKVLDLHDNGYADRRQQTASIQSLGDLVLEAERTIKSMGGQFSSGGATTIDAGQDVEFRALEIERYAKDEFKDGYSERYSLTNQLVEIDAGTELTINSGGGITFAGTKASSGGDTRIAATGNVHILAVHDRQSSDFKLEIKTDGLFGFFGSKTDIREKSSSTETKGSSINAGGNLTINSGRAYKLEGSEIHSKGDMEITSMEDADILAVQDERFNEFKHETETDLKIETIGKSVDKQSSSRETKGSKVEAGGALTITSEKGDINIGASKLVSGKETTFNAEEGKLALLTNTDTDSEKKERGKRVPGWWKKGGEGHVKETIKHVEIEAGGGLKINVGEGIVVEYEKTGDLNASIDRLIQSPALEWMGQLREDPRVDWVGVQAEFDKWDYEDQGLTDLGASLVAAVVSWASAGTLSGLSATLAQGLGFATDGALQAALKVGFETLADKAALELINNQGDIGATLDALGSSDSVRGLVSSMVATGITAHISDVAGIGENLLGTAPLPDRVVQDTQRNLVSSTVEANISIMIEDGVIDGELLYKKLVSNLRQGAASVIEENAGEVINQKFGSDEIISIPPESDEISDRLPEFLTYALAECISQAVGSDDCVLGSMMGGALDKTTEQEQEYISEEAKEKWNEIVEWAENTSRKLFPKDSVDEVKDDLVKKRN